MLQTLCSLWMLSFCKVQCIWLMNCDVVILQVVHILIALTVQVRREIKYTWYNLSGRKDENESLHDNIRASVSYSQIIIILYFCDRTNCLKLLLEFIINLNATYFTFQTRSALAYHNESSLEGGLNRMNVGISTNSTTSRSTSKSSTGTRLPACLLTKLTFHLLKTCNFLKFLQKCYDWCVALILS